MAEWEGKDGCAPTRGAPSRANGMCVLSCIDRRKVSVTVMSVTITSLINGRFQGEGEALTIALLGTDSGLISSRYPLER